jgi:muramoyltetrapeptide carboxypeptidase
MTLPRAFVKPPAIRVGDTIAFVAPSSGFAVHALHRLNKAREVFEAAGYMIKIYASVTRSPQENVAQLVANHQEPLDPAIYGAQYPCYGSADAITRAQDLMAAFLDPQVRAIVCTIGGLNSHELLEYLDFELIREHAKIFVGYSDITSLHCALQARAGVVSFYGPSAICQFGEFPEPLAYTMEYFWRAVTTAKPLGSIKPSREWTDDKTADWTTKTDITYVNKMKPNAGYEWLREGTASGPLLGGCLPVLLNVRGTPFMPDLTGAVLLLETPESEHAYDQGMSLDSINMVLGSLRIDGTFAKIQGLLVGRVYAHSEENVREIKRLILYHTRGTQFPILYGVDSGHSDPVLTLPLGCRVTLDSKSHLFRVHEAGVA